MQSLKVWLSSVPAVEAGVLGVVVRAELNDSLSYVLQIMKLHNILCVPVINVTTGLTIGLIDMADIIAFIFSKLVARKDASQTVQEYLANVVGMNDLFVGLLTCTTAKEVINFSGRNPWFFLPQTASLWEALELIEKHKLHRLGVVDDGERLATILTQSTVVAFVATHKQQFVGLLSKRMTELGSVTNHKLITIHQDKRAIEAFGLMQREKVSALAVVDEKGHLVGNISNRDFKQIGCRAEAFDSLYLPITNYLKNESKLRFWGHTVFTYEANDTLEHVVSKVIKHHIHRIYLVEKDKEFFSLHEQARAVCSLGDIIRIVLKS